MLHAVIMAGGSGTRFWPASRARLPKQLLPILGGRAMIAETAARLAPLVPPERTWVVTNRTQAAGVRRACPEIPEENVLLEPQARNTAPCVGLAATALRMRDPEAMMAVLPADHAISPPEEFHRGLRAAAQAAAQAGVFVTFGIPPTRPATGYGYILRAELVGTFLDLECFSVEAFVEKPDRQTAERFLEAGTYFWNSGIFVWRADTVLHAIAEHMPELDAGLERIRAALGGPREEEVLDRVYPGLPAVPVDIGLMEKVGGVRVLATPFHWSDVGSWEALWEELDRNEDGNVAILPGEGALLADGSRDCLVYSDTESTVALLGVEDLVVVRTGDALLVARRDCAEEVKRIVERLRKARREDLL